MGGVSVKREPDDCGKGQESADEKKFRQKSADGKNIYLKKMY